ncbi:Hypothetical_protein [Hexamita inflata]|uniref:Hypothetical_protein n=1 Tax=Hexamita inflata TaxID=28002 RepID=A0AA86PME3_9EUKA|nr:Hypothetical protein HINF_LOCUS27458 [Hexamita inflata]
MTHLRSQYVKLRWQHDWSHSKPTLLFSQCEQLHISSQCSSVFQRPQNSFSRDNEVEIIPLIQFCVNRRGNRNLILFIFLATFQDSGIFQSASQLHNGCKNKSRVLIFIIGRNQNNRMNLSTQIFYILKSNPYITQSIYCTL